MARAKPATLDGVRKKLGVGEGCMFAAVAISAKQAKWLLAHCNRDNRRIRKTYVETLSRDMVSGNWHPDVDHIGFSPEGKLINGQHRLKARVLAGDDVEVAFNVDFGIEQHVAMDTGNQRRYQDQVKIAAGEGYQIMSDAHRRVINACAKVEGNRLNLSNNEYQAVQERYGDQLGRCNELGLFDLGKVNSPAVHASLFCAFCAGVDEKVLEHVADVLKTGITSDKRDIPIVRLRDELMLIRGAGHGKDLKRALYTQQCVFDVLRGSESNRLPSRPVLHYQEASPVRAVLGYGDQAAGGDEG